MRSICRMSIGSPHSGSKTLPGRREELSGAWRIAAVTNLPVAPTCMSPRVARGHGFVLMAGVRRPVRGIDQRFLAAFETTEVEFRHRGSGKRNQLTELV